MAPTDAFKPRITTSALASWSNWHQSFKQPIRKLVDVWNGRRDRADGEFYNGTTRGLQWLVSEASRRGEELRGLGGAWSFSKVAATSGYLTNTKLLNYKFPVAADQRHALCATPAEDLHFVQCGNSVAELNRYLRERGRSLRTCGASNGQTIVGAFSTGTHGSAIDVGSTQDFVRAMHVVVSPTRSVWLERATEPVMSDAFVAALGAEPLRIDALFDAALIAFGSFGIVHGVVIESEKQYFLEAQRKRMPLDAGLWAAIDRLDFSGVDFGRADGKRPHHFQVVIDPHDMSRGAYVTVMFKVPQRTPNLPPPDSGNRIAPGDNALEVLGVILDRVSELTAEAVSFVTGLEYKDYEPVCGTLGELFTDTTTRGKAASAAMGLPLGRVREALEIAEGINRSFPFPGLFSTRYVKSTRATLGFTRHGERSCVLELDAPNSQRTKAFYRRVWRAWEAAGIPYSFHWGKVNDLDAERVRALYGDAQVEAWIAARRTLLDTPETRAVFANDFLRSVAMHD